MIGGEWWIDLGGHAMYADGDTDHVGLAFVDALGIYVDALPDDVRNKIPVLCEDIKPEDLEWLIELGADAKFVKWAIKEGKNCDPRKWAMKEMKWIRVASNNFQVWKFNDDALRRIQRFDEWESIEADEGPLEEMEETVGIEELSTGWFEFIPIGVLFKVRSATGLKRYMGGIGKFR